MSMLYFGSAVGGLSPLQTVKIYRVYRLPEGGWGRVPNQDVHIIVGFPIGETVLTLSTNWNSPFENAGLESVAGNTTSLLQSGELAEIAQLIGLETGQITNAGDRSSMNLLSSTQIFSGQPPADLPLTLRFRAIKDAHKEVELPIRFLASWMVAQEIREGGGLRIAAKDAKSGSVGAETLLPTKIPVFVCVEYGNRIFQPMIIESITEPINTKLNRLGQRTECEISLKLQSLFAWDRDKYNATYRNNNQS